MLVNWGSPQQYNPQAAIGDSAEFVALAGIYKEWKMIGFKVTFYPTEHIVPIELATASNPQRFRMGGIHSLDVAKFLNTTA